jgi:3-mercaptopyruvate sulfurtransferase SseA
MAENRKNYIPLIIVGGGTLLLIAVFAWVVLKQTTTPMITPTPASVEQAERVSLADAKAAYEARKAVFVDVRDSSSFEASHIPGALSIPLNDLNIRIGELDPKMWIIPYCS